MCPECPDERHIPPFKPIGPLPIYRREHEERTGHRLVLYCFVCCDFHSTEAVETPLEIVWLPDGPPEYSESFRIFSNGVGQFASVLAAMEVLRRAGYLVRVVTVPALPAPAKLLLPCTEAETLEVIRKRPGITTAELVQEMGLARTTIKSRVKMLRRGGHVKGEGYNSGGFALLHSVGDKPIGRVRPRQKIRPRRQGGPGAGAVQGKSVTSDTNEPSRRHHLPAPEIVHT